MSDTNSSKPEKNSTTPTELKEPASPDSGSGVELRCARKTCQILIARVWWNPSTRNWYCRECALRINEFNPGLCFIAKPGTDPPEPRAAPAITADEAELGQTPAKRTEPSESPSPASESWTYVETTTAEVKVDAITLRAHWDGGIDKAEVRRVMQIASAAPDLLAYAQKETAYRMSLAGCPNCTYELCAAHASINRALEKQRTAVIAKAEGKDS